MISRYAWKKFQEWQSARRAAALDSSATNAEASTESAAVAVVPRRRVRPAAPRTTVIDARGLVKRYGSLTAVDHISFHVETGEIFGLLGPNGAGKTTTLEMLEGLRTPDGGEADVLGKSVVRDARLIKERIGVQLQATALPPMTTVAEAIDLFGAFYQQRRPTEELLAEFDLTEKASAMTESLSGGQMQRLSIALALVNDPDLVFLDEPTTGLDPQARLNLWGVIEGIQAQGTTVIITTHYMEEAERLCDRVGVIDRGHIVALDTPERLIATHAPGASIEFDTAMPDEAALRAVPGVDRLEIDGEHVALHTETAERALAHLFDPNAPWADSVRSMRDLRVHQGTLEDVFITLTGRTLRP